MEPISCQWMKGLRSNRQQKSYLVQWHQLVSPGCFVPTWDCLTSFSLPLATTLNWLSNLSQFTTATYPAEDLTSFLPGCWDSNLLPCMEKKEAAGFCEHVVSTQSPTHIWAVANDMVFFQIACHEEESNGEVSIFHQHHPSHVHYPCLTSCMFKYLKV